MAAPLARRSPLTARGWAVLGLGTACLPLASAVGATEAQYAGTALLALLGASWFGARVARPDVQVGRRLGEESVEVGTATAVDLLVAAEPPRRAPTGRWRDSLPRELDGDASGALPRGAGSQTRARYEVTGLRRGRHAIGPLEVTSTDAFGLWRRTVAIGEPTPVLVVPRARWITPLPRAHGDTGEGGLTDERRGRGSDNLIPRPYAPGDSMRRIHWRASAHRGSFMVRDEEDETVPSATVVIDLAAPRWPSAARSGEDPGFERAVTACVSAAWRLACDGYAVTVSDHAGRALFEASRAEGSVLEALERAFATIVPDRADLGRGGESTGFAIDDAPGPLVVVCGVVDERLAEELAPLARRASPAVLLASEPTASAQERLADEGWAAGRLGDDVAASWQAALERLDAAPGGTRGHR